MGFFNIEPDLATSPAVKRLEKITWLLIYGGLLVLLVGIFTLRQDEVVGWITVGVGSLAAITGFVLIYVRSRIR